MGSGTLLMMSKQNTSPVDAHVRSSLDDDDDNDDDKAMYICTLFMLECESME